MDEWKMTDDECKIFNRLLDSIAAWHRNMVPYPLGSEPKLKNALVYAIAKEISQMKKEVSSVAFFGHNLQGDLVQVIPKKEQPMPDGNFPGLGKAKGEPRTLAELFALEDE